MALIVPNEGEILLLQYMINMTAAEDQVLRLYTNDPTLGETTVRGDLTDSTEAGYSPITLTAAGWTTTQVSGITTGVYDEVTFTYTTSASVYGYFVTDMSQNDILWVERFSGAPFNLPTGGGTIAITTKITLD